MYLIEYQDLFLTHLKILLYGGNYVVKLKKKKKE